MYTVTDKVLSLIEKVVHVAYGCGCVRTFHVEHQTPEMKCDKHDSAQISFTEECRPKAA